MRKMFNKMNAWLFKNQEVVNVVSSVLVIVYVATALLLSL